MTTTNNAPLSGSDIQSASSQSAALIVVLNNSANTLINQAAFPNLNVAGLENINDHLSTAKDHANAWINTYSGEVLNTLQGIITFGELFNNLYGSMYQSAQAMADETSFKPNEISDLIADIQALQSQVQGQQTVLNKTYTDITTYKTQVSSDYSNFTTDYNTAQATLGGDQGAIAKLQDKIDAENSALTKDALMIAGGAVGIIAGVICIVAGVFGEIETAGVSTGLVVVGIALVVGGATVTGIGGKNYDDTLKSLQTDYTNLQNMSQEITSLKTISTQFTNLDTVLATSQQALQTLVTAWQTLNNSFTAVISDLQNPENYLSTIQQNDPTATPKTVSTIVSAELQTANQDWQDAVSGAKDLLGKINGTVYLKNNSTLPTQDNIAQTYNQNSQAA